MPPYYGIYIDGRWAINFSIPFGAPFGYYDIRANITDEDYGYSGWVYLNDTLLISNENPEINDIALSNYKVYRNNTIFLNSNCSDYETPEAELTHHAEYKHVEDTD